MFQGVLNSINKGIKNIIGTVTNQIIINIIKSIN